MVHGSTDPWSRSRPRHALGAQDHDTGTACPRPRQVLLEHARRFWRSGAQLAEEGKDGGWGPRCQLPLSRTPMDRFEQSVAVRAMHLASLLVRDRDDTLSVCRPHDVMPHSRPMLPKCGLGRGV